MAGGPGMAYRRDNRLLLLSLFFFYFAYKMPPQFVVVFISFIFLDVNFLNSCAPSNLWHFFLYLFLVFVSNLLFCSRVRQRVNVLNICARL